MSKFFKIASLAVSLALVTSVAWAENCTDNYSTACETQRVQSGKPDYVGKYAPTPKDMVCLSVLANRPSALVLAQGRVAKGEEVTGKVITSWRVQDKAWKQTASGFVREICIPSKMVAGTVTLCNEENRSIWTDKDTSLLRKVKRIPAGDPSCLLGTEACAKLGL